MDAEKDTNKSGTLRKSQERFEVSKVTFDVSTQRIYLFRKQVGEILDFLHEVNGDKFVQSADEITQRLDCIISVSC